MNDTDDRKRYTPRAMAAKLGWGNTESAGRVLKREVFAAEDELGKSIFRRSSGKKAPRYTITIADLDRYLPHLRRSRTAEAQRALATVRAEFDELAEAAARREIAAHVEPQLSQLFGILRSPAKLRELLAAHERTRTDTNDHG